MKDAASQPIRSVVRALEILRVLGRSGEGVALKDLAAALGLKVPTAHHLVSTLVQEGFAERVTNPTRYRLGPAVRELHAGDGRQAWERRVEAVLPELARDLPSAVVVLAEDIGGEVATTWRIAPERPEVIQRPAHQTMSPYASACALAFQAFWGPDRREALRRRYPFEEYGPGPWAGLAELEAALESMRSEGHVLLLPGGRSTLLRVAVPVFAAGGELRAVLGASVPCEPSRAKSLGKRMAARVRESVAALER